MMSKKKLHHMVEVVQEVFVPKTSVIHTLHQAVQSLNDLVVLVYVSISFDVLVLWIDQIPVLTPRV